MVKWYKSVDADGFYVLGFENSAMKSSFSLSSLHTTPGDKTTRPAEFNSLKKKRKESLKRLSWGSSASEQQTDFWSPALAANYNYIMDNQLIDNCQVSPHFNHYSVDYNEPRAIKFVELLVSDISSL